MKDLMRKINSFITFDLPVNRNYLAERFATTHLLNQKDIPQWSTNATRQKIIASYWFGHVVSHFTFLFGFPALLFAIASWDFAPLKLPAIFIAGLITFTVMSRSYTGQSFIVVFFPSLKQLKNIMSVSNWTN